MRKRPLKSSNKLMKRVSVFRISSHGNPLLISSPDSYSAGKHTVWAISRKDAWQTTIPSYVSLLITRYCLSRLYPLTFPILSGSVALWWRSQKWGHERESGVGMNRLRLKARTGYFSPVSALCARWVDITPVLYVWPLRPKLSLQHSCVKYFFRSLSGYQSLSTGQAILHNTRNESGCR